MAGPSSTSSAAEWLDAAPGAGFDGGRAASGGGDGERELKRHNDGAGVGTDICGVDGGLEGAFSGIGAQPCHCDCGCHDPCCHPVACGCDQFLAHPCGCHPGGGPPPLFHCMLPISRRAWPLKGFFGAPWRRGMKQQVFVDD